MLEKAKKRFRQIWQSVFMRIVVFFVCIVTVTYGIGFFLLEINIKANVEQYEAMVWRQMNLYFSTLEKEISVLNAQLYTLLSDENIEIVSYAKADALSFDSARAVNRLNEQIRYLSESSFVEEIRLDLIGLNRQIGAVQGQTLYQPTDRAEILKFVKESRSDDAFVYFGDELYLMAMNGIYADFENNMLPTMVRVKVSKPYLAENIKTFSVTQDAQAALLFDEGHILLCTENADPENIRQLYYVEKNRDGGASYCTYDGERCIVLSVRSESLPVEYIQVISYQAVFADMLLQEKIYIGIGAILILLFALYTVYLYTQIKKPLAQIAEGFACIEKEEFVELTHKQADEFTPLFHSFNRMSHRLRSLIEDVYKQKILKQKAELRQLQAQINPHFLYNSFFILKKRLSHHEWESAEHFCDMLGKYFSYITKNYDDYSTLEEEVDYARIYAEIQNMRFKGRIEAVMDPLPESYRDYLVPKLIVQPLLENAYKHGLENMEFEAYVYVHILADDNAKTLKIIVEDNAESVQKNQKLPEELNKLLADQQWLETPTGIANIHRRLQLFFQGESGLMFSESSMGGLAVTLTFSTEYLKRRSTDNAHDPDC